MFGPQAGSGRGGGGRTMNNWEWVCVREHVCVWSTVNNVAAAPFLNERGWMSLSSASCKTQMRGHASCYV